MNQNQADSRVLPTLSVEIRLLPAEIREACPRTDHSFSSSLSLSLSLSLEFHGASRMVIIISGDPWNLLGDIAHTSQNEIKFGLLH